MAIWTPHPGKLSLVFLGLGAASLGYGSVWTAPHLRGGQVALSIAVGGVLLVLAAFRLAFLIALRPAVADALFVTPQELRSALGPLEKYDADVSFTRFPALRWILLGVFLLAGVGGLLLLGVELWAARTLGAWLPPYAGWLVIG